MIAKSFLALLSKHISIGKESSESGSSGESFGGINVILCGDLHQFPPVATAPSEALYQPLTTWDSDQAKLGRQIYKEFGTVVILWEQMRVMDDIWHDFLHHLQHGHVQDHHIKMLRTLLITNQTSESVPVDFSTKPWKDARLVTPRHAVRTQWNEAAARKWCHESGNQLLVCNAEDTISGRALSLKERYGVATRRKTEKRRKQKDLPMKVEIAKGMRVMVTDNVETDLDVTNGARGEIVDIILHPDEPPLGDDPIVQLKYLPAYILVKMEQTRATALNGLDDGVIPVEVVLSTFRIKIKDSHGKIVQRTVRRRQFPMTAAYTFTDYRSQGQTIPYVIVDIASPPSGTLSLFNLYVALSRSSGRSTIRLLRDFDDNLFKKPHDMALMVEDDRLDKLDKLTKVWWERMGHVQPTNL
jgi:hypothetical protein